MEECMKKNKLISILVLCILLISCTKRDRHIVILHTNDVHSAIESDTSGVGGAALRCVAIQKIRDEEPTVFLFDAGDFYQGTAYFNFFKGKVETEIMNRLGYDAINIGNHEFDNGTNALLKQLSKFKGTVLSANYDFAKSDSNRIVKPYTVIERNGIRLGVFGLGVNPEGLINKDLMQGVIYSNPLPIADKLAAYLKNEKKCDVVVCLSHLGYRYSDEPNKVCDSIVALKSTNIDIIIGGHTHQMIVDKKIKNKEGREVVISQMGKNGLNLGRIDIHL